MESSKSILNFGNSVEPGQWYDIRSEGLQPRFFYDVQVNEVQAHSNTTLNSELIDYNNFGDGLCNVLNISPQSFVQNLCYSKNNTKFMSFVLPSSPKFAIIKVEKTLKQKRAKAYNKIHDTTHFVKNVYYGNIVLIRIIPKNNSDANDLLHPIIDNLNEFMESNQGSQDFMVETLTNFNEWNSHENVKAAVNYAYGRVEHRWDNKVVRFDLEKMKKKTNIWQESVDSVEILDKLLRVEFIIHGVENFLIRSGVETDSPNSASQKRKYFTDLKELSIKIEEKGKYILENPILNPKTKLTVRASIEYVKDLLHSLVILKSECQKFLRKKILLIKNTSIENEIIDRNIIFFNIFHTIFGFLERNNFENINGKFMHVIRESKHKNILQLKQRNHQKVLIINGGDNVAAFNEHYDTFEKQKIFLVCIPHEAVNDFARDFTPDKNEKAWYYDNKGSMKPIKISHESKNALPWLTSEEADENENMMNEEIENIFDDPQTQSVYQKHPKIKNSNGAAKRKLEKVKEKSAHTKNINIVVIGESGVGKSTLLNAISNYLKFDSSKDAFENDLDYIIPCQFKVFNQDYSETIVSIGMPNENEIYDATVYSTTQDCKQHSFEFNGFKINFIDTPGLSDTSGIEKDAHNLEKIRDFICSLDYLHAICFVLKANESRMDVSFSNAMSDLLSIFPKSALSKVIFFMTHSRGTFFGPGDSMQPLTQFSNNLLKNKGVTFQLSSDNIFCVDNESFLYLCAKNQGIEYTGATMEDYENSWKKSKQACEKFFNKVTVSKPLVPIELQIIKDLENVLAEQKQIMDHKNSNCLLIFHYLTAKALELLELGNTARAYLKDIDMKIIKEEAEHCNVEINHIKPSSLLSFINFSLECENGETPVADSFIDKYLV